MQQLTVRSQAKNYSVFFENDFGFLENLKQKNGIWIIDRNVFTIYKKYFEDIEYNSIILFDASEDNKNIGGVAEMYRALLAKNIKRSRPIISVGGGITQDVSGFAASTLYRGIRWIYVPTTLLAQADSCIGSKTSLNFDSFKNLIGTFYAPDEVFISGMFLGSQSAKDWHSGFGEIVKLQLMRARQEGDLSRIADRLDMKKHPDGLLELIYDSLLVKKQYIEADEFDAGERRLLNYGHCFGHALESASHFAVPHGLAVVIGMLFAVVIAAKRQRISQEAFDIMTASILLPHLHAELLGMRPEFFDSQALFQNMQKDKKRTGPNIALVLPRQSLELEVVQDLSEGEVIYGVGELKKLLLV